MFGELYFPSVEDVDGNPTPLRMVKIPIEFESLNEYKNTFRAALRGKTLRTLKNKKEFIFPCFLNRTVRLLNSTAHSQLTMLIRFR